MKALLTSTALILGMLASAGVYAETAPAGATGLCKDGSYYTGSNKKGACRGHKGVQEWYASTAAAPATTTTAAKTTKPAPMPVMSPAATSGAAPAGSTGLCNDGSYYNGANKQGACRGHKGIKDWYGPATSAAAATTVATAAPAAPAATPAPEKKGMFSFLNKKPATPAPAATPNTATAPSAAPSTTSRATKPVAAGGGAGQVWVNTDSKVYHCQNSQWYGKTKVGQYMTEAAAKAAGARPDHGKACS